MSDAPGLSVADMAEGILLGHDVQSEIHERLLADVETLNRSVRWAAGATLGVAEQTGTDPVPGLRMVAGMVRQIAAGATDLADHLEAHADQLEAEAG